MSQTSQELCQINLDIKARDELHKVAFTLLMSVSACTRIVRSLNKMKMNMNMILTSHFHKIDFADSFFKRHWLICKLRAVIIADNFERQKYSISTDGFMCIFCFST